MCAQQPLESLWLQLWGKNCFHQFGARYIETASSRPRKNPIYKTWGTTAAWLGEASSLEFSNESWRSEKENKSFKTLGSFQK